MDMVATAIDLFCGAGGLSLGLEEAGFSTVLAVEVDANACSTYRAALPSVHLKQTDVRRVDFSLWRGIDLIAGGPPCQPFSSGGRRKGRNDDRDFLPEFVRAVVEAQPRSFLLENVPGLLSPVHRHYLREVLAPLMENYNIHGPQLINAADYGVPQKRRRMIVVGMKIGEFRLPKSGTAFMAAGEVLTENPEGEPNKSKVVYAKTPDLRPNPYHGQLFNGGGRPIDLESPAPTMLASAGGNKTHFLDLGNYVPPYHQHLMNGGRPRSGELPEARRLTVDECAALQTFPKGMKFYGSRSSQYTQVGNAVPPRLSAILGDAILCSLKRQRRLQDKAILS